MDRLPEDPRYFREMVEADLRRAARLVIKVQDEIDWQFRMATPRGDYALVVTMPTDDYERKAMLRRLATFMAWREVSAFTLAVETYEPDAVYCIGISAGERHSCLSRIRRQPKPWSKANFGSVEWLPAGSIDPVLLDLLPKAPRAMTPKEISALETWFGVSGKFPAVHVESKELRGLT